MLQTMTGVIEEGRIKLLERADLPEGSRVLVTLLPAEDDSFWRDISEVALARIWDNPEDDRYAELLDS